MSRPQAGTRQMVLPAYRLADHGRLNRVLILRLSVFSVYSVVHSHIRQHSDARRKNFLRALEGTPMPEGKHSNAH